MELNSGHFLRGTFCHSIGAAGETFSHPSCIAIFRTFLRLIRQMLIVRGASPSPLRLISPFRILVVVIRFRRVERRCPAQNRTGLDSPLSVSSVFLPRAYCVSMYFSAYSSNLGAWVISGSCSSSRRVISRLSSAAAPATVVAVSRTRRTLTTPDSSGREACA